MASRFTLRRPAAPDATAPDNQSSTAVQGASWTTYPEPDSAKLSVPAEPSNPLLTDKFLDAKVRLHRRLIEEINLSALEKLPEDEMRAHIQQLVTQHVVT